MKRKALEDAVHVPEAVRRTQQQLDEQHYAREFEAAVEDMTRYKDDAVFNDIVGLYAWGDLTYRQSKKAAVFSNPWHECTKACRPRLVDVFVYRRTLPMAAAPPSATTTVRDFTDAIEQCQARTYHLCFPETCPHLIPGHACVAGGMVNGQCWHAMRDQPEDTRRLDQFWVCRTTGNVHVCGDLCTQTKTVSDREGDMVCPLTGQVVARQMVLDGAHGSSTRDPRFASTSLLLGGGGGSAATTNTEEKPDDPEARHRAIMAQSRGHVAEPERRLGLRRHFMGFVAAMCDEIFFSVKRQELEANIYITALRRAYEDLTKYMRVPKINDDMHPGVRNMVDTLMRARTLAGPDGPGQDLYHDPQSARLIGMPRGFDIYASRAPFSAYFANVPIMDDVARSLVARRSQLEFEYINTDPRHPSDIPALRSMHSQYAPCPEREQAIRDYARVLGRTVAQSRAARGVAPYPGPVRWTSPVWQERRRVITETYATVVVTVWEKLYDNASTSTREGLVFGRIALGLMYVTKTSLLVEDVHIAQSQVHVTVVPAIRFSELLPRDNQLDAFNQHVIAPLVGARRLTVVQSCVRNAATEIAATGRLPAIQLRLLDVVSEDAARKCMIYAGSATPVDDQ